MANLEDSFKKEKAKREKLKKIKVGGIEFTREGDILYVIQENSPKAITIEKLIKINNGEKEREIEYKISYFLCTDLKKDKWKRSAFHPLIPRRALIKLLEKARKDKNFSDFTLQIKKGPL